MQQRPHRLRDAPVPRYRGRRPPRPRPTWERATRLGPRMIASWARFRPLLAAFRNELAIMRQAAGPESAGAATTRVARPASPARRVPRAATAASRSATARPSASSPSAAATAVRASASTVTSADTRAQHAVGRRRERRRAVAARQPDRERLDPRAPVRPLLLGRPLARHELGAPAPAHLVGRARVRRPLLQRGVALGEGAELLAGARQVGVGGGGALLRLGERVGQPLDLLRRGRGPAAQRFGAARERRQPGTPVGERPDGGQVRPFRRGQRALVLRPRLGDLRERAPRLHDRRNERLPPARRSRRPRRRARRGRGRVRASPPRPRGVAPAPGPAARCPRGARPAADSRYQVSCAAASRGASSARAASSRSCSTRPAESWASTSARRARALASSASSWASSSRSVTRSSAASRSRESRSSDCTACARRAISACRAERLELTAQLGGEVGEPREVGLHRVELAERLLLALAVLEDACGLLDVGAPVLRLRREHRVELALPDDDVHLAADAGVGEQLLDVEQTAVAAVDLVLARAVAEHAPGDRHLGVVDGERAVRVVDRERDLGASERRPPGRAREDDVLHLPAAQRLGPLLTQHPADGVDDVGLPRAVRADDAGDARLEAQRRRRGEGLEALQRQALEVHGEAPGAIEVPRAYRPRPPLRPR